MTVTVELLVDREELLVPLARLRWTEWGGHPGREDVRWWIDTTRAESGVAGLPVTFAAVDASGEVVGGVGLVAAEHPELGDRGPWVVGMIVRADLRGHGVGAVLMARLAQWAAGSGVDRLWVAADGRAVDFYRRCGFTVVEHVRLADGEQPTLLTRQADQSGT
ncbi:MAG TPA: GNAT family N-acetyltransferase [Pseudonocardiaceae bacterium]|nr:GNAT family N-acetyltransferase [Pseudonocardiaceae bacterium]